MHPPLGRPHPDCGEEIAALVTCHTDHPWAKFWGKCNEQKKNMDWCFKAEKEKKRKANAERAREKRDKFEKAKVQRDSE